MQKKHARAAVIAATVAAATILTVGQAQAVTLTTIGTGYKLQVDDHITSIRPSRQFTITFESATTKNLTAKYYARMLPQLNTAGVKIAVGGVETVAAGKCPPQGHIYITRVKSPLGVAGKSRALPCHGTGDTAWGGIVQMESRYYDGSYTLPTWRMWNVHDHEVMHLLGEEHPNYDKDRDGVVEPYECATNSYGFRPIMCTPNGGSNTSTGMGKLTGMDLAGVTALLKNAKLQGFL